MNKYKKGQEIQLSAAFTVDDIATDPTTVELKVMDPAGTVESYLYSEAEVTQSETGRFYKNIDANQEGLWKYGWIGTGAVATAEFDAFLVQEWPFS